MRQRSRAFIVADASSPNDRILFINSGAYLPSYMRAATC